MTAHAGMVGSPPVLSQQTGNPEALKYGQLWATDAYRQYAPGETLVLDFLTHANPASGSKVIDFGCGTGRGSRALAEAGLHVTAIDFVRNAWDADVQAYSTAHPTALTFLKADLEQRIPRHAQYGFCTDVMEHIPPDKVDRVLDNILLSAQHVFFQIATVPDAFGATIGQPLHLTVKPYRWWLMKFTKRECVIHWSAVRDGACLFYVTGWVSGEQLVKSGVLNIDEQQVVANVKHNITQGWQQAMPHEPNEAEVCIVGGGPSLEGELDTLRALRANGAKLVTLNGAYQWCLDHGLTPSATVVVDARDFNARFTKPVIDTCKYLIASQCHPSVFEGLPQDRTYIWHASLIEGVADALDAQYEHWVSVPGGSTVLLRTIPLLRMLGFTKFHLFGCDSCVRDTHHAYAQPENDAGVVLPVTLSDGRMFYAHPWMISQAHEFIQLIERMGDVIDLAIYGDGLLKHILEVGAALPEPKEK